MSRGKFFEPSFYSLQQPGAPEMAMIAQTVLTSMDSYDCKKREVLNCEEHFTPAPGTEHTWLEVGGQRKQPALSEVILLSNGLGCGVRTEAGLGKFEYAVPFFLVTIPPLPRKVSKTLDNRLYRKRAVG